jgi:hypothetical protein
MRNCKKLYSSVVFFKSFNKYFSIHESSSLISKLKYGIHKNNGENHQKLGITVNSGGLIHREQQATE